MICKLGKKTPDKSTVFLILNTEIKAKHKIEIMIN